MPFAEGPHHPEPVHRTIVVVDVARYTDPARDVEHQKEVRRGLRQVTTDAFAEAHIDIRPDDVEDRGDGLLIMVPPTIPKIRLADGWVHFLLAGLRRYNKVHTAAATIQLRVAMHFGEVVTDANGQVSPEVDFAFRILDAEAAKKDLARSRGTLAVIASNPFFQKVIKPDPAVEPDSFRCIPVRVKRTDDVAWLRLLGGESSVLSLFQEAEFTRLRQLLEGVQVREVATIVDRAAGPGVPKPDGGDAWELFRYLSDFNANQDGFPPAMAFVELVARQVGGVRATKLLACDDDQAGRLGLTDALAAWRRDNAPPAADERLHLLIAIDHDAIDRDLFLVSHWRQDDAAAWPPPRGETRLVRLADLESQVDELVVAAERAWAGHKGSVAIEFILPRDLLAMPVHRWRKELDTGDPQLLCVPYTVVVRSLERMRSEHWRREWLMRRATLAADPAGVRLHFAEPADPGKPGTLDVVFQADPRIVSVALSAPPPADPAPGDQLTAALRAGLPAVFWDPTDGGSDELRQVVGELVEDGGLIDLPTRAKAMRHRGIVESKPGQPNICLGLVVMWDDPSRLIGFDQPPENAAGQGGAA